jgi:hypothetical protein
MKSKIAIAITITILILYSCQNKSDQDKTKSNNIIKTIAEDTLSKTVAGTADLSNVPVKDDKTVKLIQKELQVLLKKDLPAMSKEDRYFYYEAFDLNNDKKNEYLIGFSNSYFCGSGGCSGYILNNDGSLINSFTITDFPIHITTATTENFYDLIIESGGKLHQIKMKNGKYPSNPSVQEKWKGEVPEDAATVLDISGKKLEKYSF